MAKWVPKASAPFYVPTSNAQSSSVFTSSPTTGYHLLKETSPSPCGIATSDVSMEGNSRPRRASDLHAPQPLTTHWHLVTSRLESFAPCPSNKGLTSFSTICKHLLALWAIPTFLIVFSDTHAFRSGDLQFFSISLSLPSRNPLPNAGP